MSASKRTTLSRSHRMPGPPGLSRARKSGGGVFIEFHELAQGDGEVNILRGREWIHPQRVFQPRHHTREAEGIQPRFQKHQILAQGRQLLLLLARDLRELLE